MLSQKGFLERRQMSQYPASWQRRGDPIHAVGRSTAMAVWI